ncbi:aminotransferase DegT [Candidatus Woesearchaeota archaeon B3_Woes]|nr:MAG: aminotransferase DegT [Candidatus Woesearchaeota archaeon B3_Woes]
MKDSKIPVAEPDLNGNELDYVTDCIKSSWVSSKGEYIKKFEDAFSKYCNVKHSISTSNGTAALHLALIALGIKEGDEVIVPNLTFIASANTVKYCNAKPVFVDVDKETWNIDANKIEEKITNKTKAIMPVHLYGSPCDMDKIMEIAKKHNLFVIEDCAEAHGAEYKGKKVGGFGNVACFSFFGNKIITTGEGGMCITNNNKLAEKMKILKDHGMSNTKRYWHPLVGYNYRMTNIQAAIGLAQLERIEDFIEIRRKNAQLYDSLLKNVKGIRLSIEKENTKNVYWMYSILLENREEVMERLKEDGVDTRPFFYPINTMPPYKNDEKFPISKELSKKGLNLPSSTLLDEKDIKRIVETIKRV